MGYRQLYSCCYLVVFVEALIFHVDKKRVNLSNKAKVKEATSPSKENLVNTGCYLDT